MQSFWYNFYVENVPMEGLSNDNVAILSYHFIHLVSLLGELVQLVSL